MSAGDRRIDRRIDFRLRQIGFGNTGDRAQDQRIGATKQEVNTGGTVKNLNGDGTALVKMTASEDVTAVLGTKVVRQGDRVFVVGGRIF